MAHWGGPVRLIDTSRATPFILLKNNEKKQILSVVHNKISEQELDELMAFLREREIVDIKFEE